jgi:hypothetical protein
MILQILDDFLVEIDRDFLHFRHFELIESLIEGSIDVRTGRNDSSERDEQDDSSWLNASDRKKMKLKSSGFCGFWAMRNDSLRGSWAMRNDECRKNMQNDIFFSISSIIFIVNFVIC